MNKHKPHSLSISIPTNIQVHHFAKEANSPHSSRMLGSGIASPSNLKSPGLSPSRSNISITSKHRKPFDEYKDHISDFYNKEQIKQALLHAETKQERLALLDFVLRRREELKAVEDRVRLEQAGPVILNFVSTFRERSARKKMKNAEKGSPFRKATRKLSHFAGAQEIRRSDSPFVSEDNSLPKGMKGLLKFLHKAERSHQNPQNDGIVDRLKAKGFPSKIDLMKKKDDKQPDLKKKILLGTLTAEEKKNLFHLQVSQKLQYLNTLGTKNHSSNSNISEEYLALENRQYAIKTLEQDLYKFMINNQLSETDEKKITSKHNRTNSLWFIEERVNRKFVEFKDDIKNNPQVSGSKTARVRQDIKFPLISNTQAVSAQASVINSNPDDSKKIKISLINQIQNKNKSELNLKFFNLPTKSTASQSIVNSRKPSID